MKNKVLIIFSALLFTSSLPVHVWAQEESGEAQSADDFLTDHNVVAKPEAEAKPVKTEQAKPVKDVKIPEEQTPEIIEKKVALARKMHEINPTRDQVDSAITRAAQALPEKDRSAFILAMQQVLNYNAIERISIDAMVDVYSLKELESMVEYYSKPEAQSASKKLVVWAQQVQPEITRMMDKAIMKVRTGAE